jgi:hypothetical protein
MRTQTMAEHVYKVIEIIGASPESFEKAGRRRSKGRQLT